MHLPWKRWQVHKSHNRSITRLVAGFQSPNRVETGFPASLVDLFLKNQDRLNKQQQQQKPNKKNKKTRKKHRNKDDKMSLDTTTDPPQPEEEQERLSSEPRIDEDSKAEVMTTTIIDSSVRSEDQRCGFGGPQGSKATAVKFLVVVVLLAFGIHYRLALGVITMSAFLLLLLEYISVNSSSKLQLVLKSVTQRLQLLAGIDMKILLSRPGLLLLGKTAADIEHQAHESSDVSNCFMCERNDDEFRMKNSTTGCEIELEEERQDNLVLQGNEDTKILLTSHRPHVAELRPDMRKRISDILDEDHDAGDDAQLQKRRVKCRIANLKLNIINKLVPKKLRQHSNKVKRAGKGCEAAGFEDQSISARGGVDNKSIVYSRRLLDGTGDGIISELVEIDQQKLAPKKLRRHSNKDKKGKGCEVAGSEDQAQPASVTVRGGEGSIASSGRSLDGPDHGITSELESGQHKLPHIQHRKNEASCMTYHSHELLKKKEEHCGLLGSSDIENKMVYANASGGKLGYVILILIVLAGLAGGKVVSFLLATGYCFVIKTGSTLRKRNSSMPLNMSFALR